MLNDHDKQQGFESRYFEYALTIHSSPKSQFVKMILNKFVSRVFGLRVDHVALGTHTAKVYTMFLIAIIFLKYL